MTRPRRLARRAWSGCLIAALLFMQFAAAAYTCPRFAAAGADMADAMPAGMPCAMLHGGPMAMDAEQPGLCLEHCKGGAQTLEPGTAGGVVPPALPVSFVVHVPSDASDGASVWHAQRQRRDHPSPPPHAILHCCFRL